METFEYKILSVKQESKSVLSTKTAWFDDDVVLGDAITAEILTRYGREGWELAGTMTAGYGETNQIILKRRT